MRAGGGKQKGASFERDVCRRLSLWLSGGLRDDLMWRSAMSGGRATVQFNRGAKNLTQSGDISAVGEGAFAFCERNFIEVKHYRDLGIGRSIVCGTGHLAKFWRVARREANRYGKRPMLVARQNLYPTIVLVEDQDERDEFAGQEMLATLHSMSARVYLFDSVTQMRVPMRRAGGER